jgi:hypothetical protein
VPSHNRGSGNVAPAPSPHEITNQNPDKPKGGWWRKLTGQ